MYYCCDKHHTEECPEIHGAICEKRELDEVEAAIEAEIMAAEAWRDYIKDEEALKSMIKARGTV